MIYAEVITPWTGDGLTLETAFKPLLKEDYEFNFTDTTSQADYQLPPQPNLTVIYIDVEDFVLDDIETDNRFYVMYRGDEAEGETSASEFGDLRSYLAQNGVDQEDINAAIGTSAGGRSRSELTEDLKAWLRTLNRA